jgi:tol-pal system protein YbgF
MRGVMRTFALASAFAAALAGAASAQNVADVRADLEVLNRQIQELRAALVQSGSGSGLPGAPATPLTRLDQLEAELRRLTNRVDVLGNDLDRIIGEASNVANDIEFRLTELEGGDTSLIGAPEPLGGGLTPPAPAPAAPETAGGGEAIAAERADFEAAMDAAKAGDNARAAGLFEAFLSIYPGGPLSAEAQYRRGVALSEVGDHRGAARSYLDAFSGAPQGPFAADALLRLAGSLGELGQTPQACLTLGEVEARYPGSEAAAQAPARRTALGCQ